MCFCSIGWGDVVRALSARDGFLSEKDPVSVLDGGDGDGKVESGKLSSASGLCGRPGVVVVAHREGKACISALESVGAERVICGTRGISDISQGGSLLAPMYPGVEVLLEEEIPRSIVSRVSSPDITALKQGKAPGRSSYPRGCNNLKVPLG